MSILTAPTMCQASCPHPSLPLHPHLSPPSLSTRLTSLLSVPYLILDPSQLRTFFSNLLPPLCFPSSSHGVIRALLPWSSAPVSPKGCSDSKAASPMTTLPTTVLESPSVRAVIWQHVYRPHLTTSVGSMRAGSSPSGFPQV